MSIDQLIAYELWGNTALQWLVALGVMALVLLVLIGVKRVALGRLQSFAQKTATRWDDLVAELLRQTKLAVLAVVALRAGAYLLHQPADAAGLHKLLGLLDTLTWVVLAVQIAFWGTGVVAHVMRRLRDDQKNESRILSAAAVDMVELLAKLVVWAVVGLAALSNLGINVSSLAAGLGIGGIAVALAVQRILGDVFCSVSILLDKPFEGGDFIVAGDKMGTVERVGIKTTRVRSLSGEEIVFPNADLVGSRIQNFKRMQERRALFTFGITYQTPIDKVEAIGAMVREIVAGVEHARLDRAHFKGFGDSALLYEVVYYITAPEYGVYMDVQQQINLALIRRFAAEGIEFAYPTQTLYVATLNGTAGS